MNSPQKLDFTKPITTRDGRKVRILCTDGPKETYPVIGVIDGFEDISLWTIDGLGSMCLKSSDLINSPQKRMVEFWVNVYPDRVCIKWDTKEQADKYEGVNRIACLYFTREITEGEGL
jgi:hypothetical protein